MKRFFMLWMCEFGLNDGNETSRKKSLKGMLSQPKSDILR